jgi:hypothetical protein
MYEIHSLPCILVFVERHLIILIKDVSRTDISFYSTKSECSETGKLCFCYSFIHCSAFRRQVVQK